MLQRDTVPDIFLITDMQITNLQRLIQYFIRCKNRVTAVHIGHNQHVQEFRRSLDLNANVSIFAVEDKKDIPRIVLGQIREYFFSPSTGKSIHRQRAVNAAKALFFSQSAVKAQMKLFEAHFRHFSSPPE
jgi:hypothetical protein